MRITATPAMYYACYTLAWIGPTICQTQQHSKCWVPLRKLEYERFATRTWLSISCFFLPRVTLYCKGPTHTHRWRQQRVTIIQRRWRTEFLSIV
jgi:hypothetical protein